MRRSRLVLVALLLSGCAPAGYSWTWKGQSIPDAWEPQHASFDFSTPSTPQPANLDWHVYSQPQASTPPIQYRMLWPDTFGSPYDNEPRLRECEY
jgi:hypothetical protein